MKEREIRIFYKSQIKKILEALEDTFELLIEGTESDIKPLMGTLEKKGINLQFFEDYNFVDNRKDYLLKIIKLTLSRKNYEKIEKKIFLFDHQGYLKFDLLFRDLSKKLILTHDGEIILK